LHEKRGTRLEVSNDAVTLFHHDGAELDSLDT
jgi:hypothetical protein